MYGTIYLVQYMFYTRVFKKFMEGAGVWPDSRVNSWETRIPCHSYLG